MSELKIKLELNKGRQGVPIKRLVRVANEALKFLELFAKDIELGEGEWLAERFTNGSAGFDNSFIGQTTTRALATAQKALRHITDPRRNVEGWITHKPDEDLHLRIESISPAPEYQEGDLQKFFGIDPDFTDDMSTAEYLDDLRGETTEDYLKRLS